MPPPGPSLAEDRLIPVRRGTEPTQVGLRELFCDAAAITDIDVGMPPAAAGLMRILTVIAARVTALDQQNDNVDMWLDRREEILAAGEFESDAVHRYLAEHADRLFLYHSERPFLQDPRLAAECPTSSGINKLALKRPAGQNQVWLDHHHDGLTTPLDATTALLQMIAQLYYGPSGRCTSRSVRGRKEANSNAGPLRRTLSFHPVGRNLFETLVAGIPFLGGNDGLDQAPWELTELSDPLGVPTRPGGVGGVLTGGFRHAVLLCPDLVRDRAVDAYLTWAWRQPTPEARDPYLIYQESKQGTIYARYADSSRALWRDVDALLLSQLGVPSAPRRPMVFDTTAYLPHDLRDALRVRAYGFHQDGQTRDKQWTTATTPAVLGALFDDPPTAGAVNRTHDAAEHAAEHLRWALRNAWVAVNDPSNGDGHSVRKDIPDGPWPAEAQARFWPRAEQVFWRRVRARDFDDAGREYVRLALAIYDQVTEPIGHRPRAKRAIERARGLIFRAASKAKGAA